MEPSEAFDVLLRELRDALKKAQNEGAYAFQEGRFDDARRSARLGEEISESIEFLGNLQRHWLRLVQGVEVDSSLNNFGRLARGIKTPDKAFWVPILAALEDLGGSGRIGEVLDRVEKMVRDKLFEVDRERLRDGRTIRWQNTAAWARFKMVKAGLLSANSPRGVWEITDAGRAYLREHRKS